MIDSVKVMGYVYDASLTLRMTFSLDIPSDASPLLQIQIGDDHPNFQGHTLFCWRARAKGEVVSVGCCIVPDDPAGGVACFLQDITDHCTDGAAQGTGSPVVWSLDANSWRGDGFEEYKVSSLDHHRVVPCLRVGPAFIIGAPIFRPRVSSARSQQHTR